jgi:hypothetical protein
MTDHNDSGIRAGIILMYVWAAFMVLVFVSNFFN